MEYRKSSIWYLSLFHWVWWWSKFYPNPTSDYLNIFFKNQEGRKDGIFRLVDMNGRVVLEFKADKMETTYMLDVERYASGIYFLQYLQPADRQGGEGVPVSTNQIIIQK